MPSCPSSPPHRGWVCPGTPMDSCLCPGTPMDSCPDSAQVSSCSPAPFPREHVHSATRNRHPRLSQSTDMVRGDKERGGGVATAPHTQTPPATPAGGGGHRFGVRRGALAPAALRGVAAVTGPAVRDVPGRARCATHSTLLPSASHQEDGLTRDEEKGRVGLPLVCGVSWPWQRCSYDGVGCADHFGSGRPSGARGEQAGASRPAPPRGFGSRAAAAERRDKGGRPPVGQCQEGP